MKIRGFVLGVALLALVGWCMISESVKQTQARYELAELGKKENELKKNLAKLAAQEQELRSPIRLAEMVREQRMPMFVLNSAIPTERAGGERKPGEVLEDDWAMGKGEAVDGQAEVASVEYW